MTQINERRILITGGSGFIGYHLAHYLSQQPENKIVLVDNFTRGKLDEELKALVDKSNVSLISADLTDKNVYATLGDNYDDVYHLAAIIGVRNVLDHPLKVLNVNATATLMLLEWFVNGGGKKLLFASTSEVYAWTQRFHTLAIPTPEDVPLSLTELDNPRSTYAGSKIFGELAVTQYCTVHEKPFVIVRFHNVYGPRMGNEHVIPELYYRALNGQNPLVVYSSNHRRAFCYVSDAISAIVMAMHAEAANNRTLNIGNDQQEVEIGELAGMILKEANLSTAISSQVAEFDPIQRRCPDITLAGQLLNYKPQINLDKGLDLTLDWYKKNYKKPE
jgi:UDP-glucose 4-epimerase/UDP-glucuronate decarboxylase